MGRRYSRITQIRITNRDEVDITESGSMVRAEENGTQILADFRR
jgi:hypothetical protein